MEPYGLRPHVVAALARIDLELGAQLVVSEQPAEAIASTRYLPVATGRALPLSLAPGHEHVTLATLAEQPGRGLVAVDRDRPRPTVNVQDDGPDPSPFAVALGVPQGAAVIVAGVIYAHGDHLGRMIVPPGRVVVADRFGRLLAAGHLRGGRAYRLGKESLVKPIERGRVMGPDVRLEFQLTFLEHDPAGEAITVERLKNRSWVAVDGVWHRADSEGRVVVPVSPGEHTVVVADRHGTIYAEYFGAEPGDTLLGAFNFSQGYGYYGFYSGKAFAVLQSFIDVFDALKASDERILFRIRALMRDEQLLGLEDTYVSKSPRPVSDTLWLEESASWALVKFTLYDEFYLSAHGSQPFSGVESDEVTLVTNYEYYNTSKWAEDFVVFLDANNRPANWIVLDLFGFTELASYSRTRTTVYDGAVLSDSKQMLRLNRRTELLAYGEEILWQNLSRKGIDTVQLTDQRAQSLIGITATDLIGTHDRVWQSLTALRASELVYLRDAYLRKAAAFVVDDEAHVSDHRLATTELLATELVEAGTRATLWSLGTPFGLVLFAGLVVFDQGQYLPSRGAYGDVELRQGGLLLREYVHGPGDAVEEGVGVLSDGILSETGFLEHASTRRSDAVGLEERHVLERELRILEVFSLEDQASIPDTSTYFSIVNIKATRMAPMLYRLEYRLLKERDGRAAMVYLTKGGDVMLVRAGPDGRWTGQPAVRLLSGLPSSAGYLDVAPGRGDELYFCYHQDTVVWIYHYAPGKGAQLVTTRTGVEPALASTYPDTPYGHVVLAYRRTSEPRRIRWEVVAQHAGADPFPHGQTGFVDFSDRLRIDQFENSQGQLVVVAYNHDHPTDRTLFHRLGAVRHVGEHLHEETPEMTVVGEPLTVALTVEEALEEEAGSGESMLLDHVPANQELQREEFAAGWGGVQREVVMLALREKTIEQLGIGGVTVENLPVPVALRETIHQTVTWRLRAIPREVPATVTSEALTETIQFPGGEYERRP